MCVLVTGAAGFIGQHLVRDLVRDRTVVGLDLEPSAFMDVSFHHTIGDVTDRYRLHSLIAAHKPSVIFHLAAISHIPDVNSRPVEGARINILGTVMLLDVVAAAMSSDPTYRPRLIFAGTGEEYAANGVARTVFHTDATLTPRSLYAGSKAAAAMMIESYRVSRGINASIARFANVYGPGQSTKNFIPMAVERLLLGGTVTLHNGGRNVREWVYVGDIVRGLRMMAEGGHNRGFGGYLATVRQVAETIQTIIREWGGEKIGRIETQPDGAPSGVVRLSPTTSPDGWWDTVTPLADGLGKIVDAAMTPALPKAKQAAYTNG